MKRKKISKAISIASVACMSAVTLASCGGSDDNNSAATDGEVNLKFYVWSDEEPYMQEVVNTYNEATEGVTVELISIPNESYDDKLRVMLAANSDADIVDIRSLEQVSQYKNSDVLLDISDYIKESNFDVSNYGPAWGLAYPDGVVTALPTRTTCWMLFYNKDIFDEAGLTMPSQLTWDEYAELALKLTDPATNQYGGFYVNWNLDDALAIQKGTYLNDDDISDVKMSIEFLNRLYNVDKSHIPLNQIQAASDSLYLSEFENGNVAMMPNGEWLISMLQNDGESGKTDINWQIAPYPISEGMEEGTTLGSFQFAAVTKATKYPKESYDFLKYLCSEGAASVFPKYSIIPAYSSESSIEILNESIGKDDVADIIINAKKIPESPALSNYGELSKAFHENSQLYLVGEISVDKAMENFEKQRKDILNK